MRLTIALAATFCLLLASCGEDKPPVKSVSTRPAPVIKSQPVRAPVRTPPPRAVAQVLPGLEGVIGAGLADLNRQFGEARLDVYEGDARKLQYSGTACVLDIYLYPSAAGREPQATYVDARRPSDGRDVDRASCIAALRKR